MPQTMDRGSLYEAKLDRFYQSGLYSQGRSLSALKANWRRVVARAHREGCVVREPDGRRVPVQPKWLLPILYKHLIHNDAGFRASRVLSLQRGNGPVEVTRREIAHGQEV